MHNKTENNADVFISESVKKDEKWEVLFAKLTRQDLFYRGHTLKLAGSPGGTSFAAKTVLNSVILKILQDFDKF